jgi:hypothetical protein
MRLYVSGPMTGLAGFNYRAFDTAAADLRARGIEVVSPAEMGAVGLRAAALASHDGDAADLEHAGHTRGALLADELRLIIDQADAVAVLPGWQRSGGALLETFAAVLHGKRVVHYPSLRRVPTRTLVRAWVGYAARRDAQ